MPKSQSELDVLVLGDHPSGLLAAAILAGGGIKVVHASIPGQEEVDRLVLINPQLFELHAILKSLKRQLELAPIYGISFLADEVGTSNESIGKSISGHIGSLKTIRAALAKLAKAAGVKQSSPDNIQINRVHEAGLDIKLDNHLLHPKILVLAGVLPSNQQKLLGFGPEWRGPGMHRYTFLSHKSAAAREPGARPAMSMSLNLRGSHCWGWLMHGPGRIQIAVEQPMDQLQNQPDSSGKILLSHWADVLASHGVLKAGAAKLPIDEAISIELPLAGALSGEPVGNRALCVGPAGGFYSACAEDIYPNCWSAVCAAETIQAALKATHVQDAMQAYRQGWGATLGDYLRGPQQNLRFLLPLVYRNPTMAARLADAILLGQSVVR